MVSWYLQHVCSKLYYSCFIGFLIQDKSRILSTEWYALKNNHRKYLVCNCKQDDFTYVSSRCDQMWGVYSIVRLYQVFVHLDKELIKMVPEYGQYLDILYTYWNPFIDRYTIRKVVILRIVIMNPKIKWMFQTFRVWSDLIYLQRNRWFNHKAF